MASPVVDIPSILDRLSIAKQLYLKDESGARESLIDLSQELMHALELPSEAIQRMGWAEVCIQISYVSKPQYVLKGLYSQLHITITAVEMLTLSSLQEQRTVESQST